MYRLNSQSEIKTLHLKLHFFKPETVGDLKLFDSNGSCAGIVAEGILSNHTYIQQPK